MTKLNLGEQRVYFILLLIARHPEKPGHSLEIGSDTKTWRNEAYWLAPLVLLSQLPYRSQAHLLRVVPTTVG